MVRIAVDNKNDVAALAEIRARVPEANLVVDLQENYRLITQVAPFVNKVRYNPGHLHHHEKHKTIREKVAFIAETAAKHDLAVRVGVNCGSVDPEMEAKFQGADPPELDGVTAMIESALEHCRILDDLGFDRYVVSLKDSDPRKVIEANTRFAAARPEIPLHLGVTEAGMLPDGVIKTRIAFEQLLSRGIGDTIRVSLTLPFSEKWREVEAGKQIIADVEAGRFRSVPKFLDGGLNIISCPSCSRVENEAFVDLAFKVKEMTAYAKAYDITIAVMGCRVNGPGETDDADIGLWCAPTFVNLKRGTEEVGAFPYDTVLDRLKEELDRLIAAKQAGAAAT
ncbi:MAG: 4-hydroxy-3-methylbut-2-en-1-yl diphosphate synthase (flavodoxin) [Tepidiforma sp.]|nr:MAG: 4-hydroxy-3-methylbut-2-en-1-yl diphosphate synthase (flavodoxin) [Tepidiforma sp.]